MFARTDRRNVRSRPSGFTLVELMVVMVIIAILAGLISVAVVKALELAKITRVTTEIAGMSQAMESFFTKYDGTYPPNFEDKNAVNRFLNKAFSRADPNEFKSLPALTPAQALVFWLSGFSPDQVHPFSGKGTRVPAFSFNVARLHDPADANAAVSTDPATGVWVNVGTGKQIYPIYLPDHSDMNQPFIYFDVSRYNHAKSQASNSLSKYQGTSGGTLTPYLNDTGLDYANPKKYQIISAGVDNDYGTGGIFPTGVGGADADNLTNFANGKLGDYRP